MGQNRTDTANQLHAKQRVADRRRCPACKRRSALSTKFELMDGYKRIGWVKTCLYCDHEVGTRNGEPFGREEPADPVARFVEDGEWPKPGTLPVGKSWLAE